MNTPIAVETVVNAPINKVWEALTNKDKMKEWYFDLKEFEPRKDFEFRFTGGTDEHQYLHICKIIEAIPNKRLTHTWTYENVPVETRVKWELSELDAHHTKVELTHAGHL